MNKENVSYLKLSLKVMCECYYCFEVELYSLVQKYQNSGGNC